MMCHPNAKPALLCLIYRKHEIVFKDIHNANVIKVNLII
jgi:hypothetical protein